LGQLELDLLGTTALLVFHDGPALLALGSLLASGSIRHGVVHLDISITGDRDLVLGGREVLAISALEARSTRFSQGAFNDLLLERALGEGITLFEAFGAGEATEVESIILGEATSTEIAPTPSTLLLTIALVVVALRGLERREVPPALHISSVCRVDRFFELTYRGSSNARESGNS
jgi:hypothetical protein